MKRVLSMLLCAVLLVLTCAGCGSPNPESGKLKVIATIFPEYEWVKNIVGDAKNVDVSLLLDKGVDLHSFQPTAEDIVNIAACDVFVYNGGESDNWVGDVLQNAKNRDMTAIDLMDAMGSAAKEEKIVEGMEHEHHHHDADHDEHEIDEHVWLSLRHAAMFVKAIAAELAAVDHANAETYRANADAYCAKLSALFSNVAAAVGDVRLAQNSRV